MHPWWQNAGTDVCLGLRVLFPELEEHDVSVRQRGAQAAGLRAQRHLLDGQRRVLGAVGRARHRAAPLEHCQPTNHYFTTHECFDCDDFH